MKLHAPRLSDVSVAVHTTVFVPMGNVKPEGGMQTIVTPGQLSLVPGMGKTTLAPLLEVAAAARFVEQTIVGSSRSTTTTI
jgi:hypothetical protein